MRLFYSLLIFGVAIQIATYLMMIFNVFGSNGVKYPVTLSSGVWDITAFSLMFAGAGGAIITIAGLLLRQGTYAIYATLIWVIGMLLNPIKGFFLAIPNTLFGMFIPIFNGMNPIPPTIDPTTGLRVYAVDPITTVLVYIVTFAAFWFLVELVSQRTMN